MIMTTSSAKAAVTAGASSCGCFYFDDDKNTTGRTSFTLENQSSASHDFVFNPNVTTHLALNFSSMAGVRGSKSSSAILGWV